MLEARRLEKALPFLPSEQVQWHVLMDSLESPQWYRTSNLAAAGSRRWTLEHLSRLSLEQCVSVDNLTEESQEMVLRVMLVAETQEVWGLHD